MPPLAEQYETNCYHNITNSHFEKLQSAIGKARTNSDFEKLESIIKKKQIPEKNWHGKGDDYNPKDDDKKNGENDKNNKDEEDEGNKKDEEYLNEGNDDDTDLSEETSESEPKLTPSSKLRNKIPDMGPKQSVSDNELIRKLTNVKKDRNYLQTVLNNLSPTSIINSLSPNSKKKYQIVHDIYPDDDIKSSQKYYD